MSGDNHSNNYFAWCLLLYIKLLSMSWLKRQLRLLGLIRRGPRMKWDSISVIKQCVQVKSEHLLEFVAKEFFLQMELKVTHGLLGYRAIWNNLRKVHGLHVRRLELSSVVLLLY